MRGFMKLRTLALAGVALIGLAGPAAAGQGWYVGMGLGWNHLENVVGTATGGSDVFKWDEGFNGLATTGFKWSDGWRLELEGDLTRNDANALLVSGDTL